jgi:hypothetical protein
MPLRHPERKLQDACRTSLWEAWVRRGMLGVQLRPRVLKGMDTMVELEEHGLIVKMMELEEDGLILK